MRRISILAVSGCALAATGALAAIAAIGSGAEPADRPAPPAGLAALPATLEAGELVSYGSGAIFDCAIPNNMVCEISHPDGIARIYVDLHDYDAHMFDETYLSCPTTVDMSFDVINPHFDIIVVPCKPKHLQGTGPGGGGRGPGGVMVAPTVPPERELDLTGR